MFGDFSHFGAGLDGGLEVDFAGAGEFEEVGAIMVIDYAADSDLLTFDECMD